MGHGCGRGRGADVALASQCSVQRLSRHPPHSVGRTQHACQPQQGEINCRWVSTVRTNMKTAVRTRAALPRSTLSLLFPFLRQRPLLLGCKVARGTGTRQVLVFSCPHRLLFLRSHVRLMGKGGVAWRGSFFFSLFFSRHRLSSMQCYFPVCTVTFSALWWWEWVSASRGWRSSPATCCFLVSKVIVVDTQGGGGLNQSGFCLGSGFRRPRV